MSLVYYGTLVAGPAEIATIRFSTPVILQTIRIVPTGISAFKNVKDYVGETTPPQFSLRIYSNALMLPTDAEPKPKASNTLLSTQLDYVDEMLDWDFAVSPPASSRLVIFQGSFKKLTIAIYGQLGDNPTVQPTDVVPTVYPTLTPRSLPPSIDVANLYDSAQTSKSLLRANPANPSLRHVFHSLLCYVTTPEGPFDEWDEISGNPIERLLESDVIDAIELMQEAIQALRKPLPDIEENTATQFIALVNESLGENPDLQTCKLLFEILGYASLQSDSLVTAVLYGISTVTYLADPRLLEDDDIPKHIERWISHPLTARYLNEPDIQEYMLAGRDQATSSENMARWEQIQSAIISWGDFYQAFDEYDEAAPDRIPRVARWLRRSFSERHFGPTMLWRLWNQPNIVDFSSDEPAFRDYNNLLLGAQGSWDDLTTLLGNFRTTLKTYMGIAGVLSVVWWSRFPPDAIACRAISILKLWAEYPGIREIVRSLVLMPIFHEALSELSVDVPLHKSGLYAQQLLESLDVAIEEADEPMSEVAPATPEPLQLSGHLEVMSAVLKQANVDNITAKRISLASQRVLRQVKETPEEPWSIFAESHQSTSESFMLTQIEVLRALKGYMDSQKESSLDADSLLVLPSLLAALANILETVSILLPYANIPAPTTRLLIDSTTAIFISSEIILSRNRRQAQIAEPSHILRQACIQLFRTLVELDDTKSAFKYPVADQVLPMVLTARMEFDGGDTMHIAVSQTAVLLDLLIPPSSQGDDAQSFWVLQIIRNLPQFKPLLSILSPRHWITLVSHLVELDETDKSIGLGSWFALDELQTLRTLVSRITLEAASGKLAVMLRVADRSVGLVVALFRDILRDNIAETLVRETYTMASLTHCLEIIVDNHATSIATAELAALLAPYAILDEPRALRRLLTTALLRGSRVAPSPYSFWLAIPQLLVPHRTFATRDMDPEVFGTDIALALVNLCAKWSDEEPQASEIWECAVRVLEWLAELEDVATVRLYGLDSTTLESIRLLIETYVPSRTSAFDLARSVLTFSPDVPEDIHTATSVIPDPSTLQTTTADIRAALSRTRAETSRETTPQPGLSHIELLALASLSPRAPTSPISPSAPLTLTKMYSHNEFRRLRQSPAARLNTSRPPSQHVDDWQSSDAV
ncbi:hypothetical protein RSOL_510450 [Rhizoctonia solani AG-3 Rhs1AP]|uniref:Virilizer N-terminal domain-containing protein n=1 Tax=Rhizoctonia solani AG-3 Rhs1AP TaxID=1086054 RepID=X8JWJ0_9AGAM|nr:hypothetical protein RSOL_510450 [Rhizoctonia solani AG-3 Rhs1AP]